MLQGRTARRPENRAPGQASSLMGEPEATSKHLHEEPRAGGRRITSWGKRGSDKQKREEGMMHVETPQDSAVLAELKARTSQPGDM